MQGTRRTIVTAAASFAVVLGVGSVAAATSGNGSHPGSTTGTTVASPHGKPTKATVRAHVEAASSTTETDDDTSTTVEEATSTTVAEGISTALGKTEADDHGDATEEANENENAELQEHDENSSANVGDTTDTQADDHHGGGDNRQGADQNGGDSGGDPSGHGGSD